MGSGARDPAWSVDFEEFVIRHGAPLVRSLALITLDRGLAEDAAQEAFLQLYLHWGDVPAMHDPVAWLYRVGINRCKDYRRSLYRRTRLVERLGQSVHQQLPGDWSPDADFVTILGSLPKRQRTAAALFYLAQASFAEIAQIMGISEGAVGSHLHKARQALRKVLEAR